MSGLRSREKGARGEREFFNELAGWLGDGWVKRNLSQARDGGPDGDTSLPVAIEVKRAETLQLTRWMRQAREQAQAGEIPVLVYRMNRQPWIVAIELTVPEFADWLRNLIGEGGRA